MGDKNVPPPIARSFLATNGLVCTDDASDPCKQRHSFELYRRCYTRGPAALHSPKKATRKSPLPVGDKKGPSQSAARKLLPMGDPPPIG